MTTIQTYLPKDSWPLVIVNFAMSADGKVSTRNWTPSNFGSTEDRRRLQEIRVRGDAIMVGRRTAEIDSMQMDISNLALRARRKAAGKSAEPIRVLISAQGPLDPKMKVFSEMRAPLIIFTAKAPSTKVHSLLPDTVIIHTLAGALFSVGTILRILRCQYHVRTVICEGGPTLMRTLLEMNAVSEINLTIEPIVFGGHSAPTLSGVPGDFLGRPVHFQIKSVEVTEGTCFVTYERRVKKKRVMP